MDLAKALKNVLALAGHGIRTYPNLTEEAMLELAADIVAVKQHATSLPTAPSPEKV